MSAFKIIHIVAGALTALGGLIGFLKAKSVPSLVAGGISGALLIVAGVMSAASPRNAAILGGIVSLLLLGRFLPAFLKSKAFMPSGMVSLLSIACIVTVILAFATKR
jgi:uncharacterized membrane protein (UPF0136 family)